VVTLIFGTQTCKNSETVYFYRIFLSKNKGLFLIYIFSIATVNHNVASCQELAKLPFLSLALT